MATKKKPATATGASEHLTIRLHPELLRRAEALLPAFAASTSLAPTGVADRSDVLRRALDLGLGKLENELRR